MTRFLGKFVSLLLCFSGAVTSMAYRNNNSCLVCKGFDFSRAVLETDTPVFYILIRTEEAP